MNYVACGCSAHFNRYTSMHVQLKNLRDNTKRYVLAAAKGMHNQWLASKWKPNATSCTTLLDIQK